MMKIRELLNKINLFNPLITIPCKFNRCEECDKVLYGKENYKNIYCNFLCTLNDVRDSYGNIKPLPLEETKVNDNFKKIININL